MRRRKNGSKGGRARRKKEGSYLRFRKCALNIRVGVGYLWWRLKRASMLLNQEWLHPETLIRRSLTQIYLKIRNLSCILMIWWWSCPRRAHRNTKNLIESNVDLQIGKRRLESKHCFRWTEEDIPGDNHQWLIKSKESRILTSCLSSIRLRNTEKDC